MISNSRVALSFISFTLAILLLTLNTVGLFLPLEPEGINKENLRFANDYSHPLDATLESIQWKENDSTLIYSNRVSSAISKRLAHIHWEKYEPERFNQTIPIWENYLIYLMAKLTDIPEYNRYHFSNPYKSLERGIGVCGDAAMNLSAMLKERHITNKIVSFPGHVAVLVTLDKEQVWLFDPDFNVVIPYDITAISNNPELVRPFYNEKGYSEKEVNNLVNKYGLEYKTWDGVKHFITNKYYFEKFSYYLIWIFPLLLFGLGMLLRSKK